jgi:hypothetical protein
VTSNSPRKKKRKVKVKSERLITDWECLTCHQFSPLSADQCINCGTPPTVPTPPKKIVLPPEIPNLPTESSDIRLICPLEKLEKQSHPKKNMTNSGKKFDTTRRPKKHATPDEIARATLLETLDFWFCDQCATRNDLRGKSSSLRKVNRKGGKLVEGGSQSRKCKCGFNGYHMWRRNFLKGTLPPQIVTKLEKLGILKTT